MSLHLPESFLPPVLVAAVLVAMPRHWLRHRVGQAALVLFLAAMVARYLWWRLTVTVWPVERWDVQSVYVWALFLIELLAWFDTAILFLILLRRTDRSAEADLGEMRLLLERPEALPTVDVFIATYNEPIEVLERTIVGALALDWPADRLKVFVLDDGRREWLRAFCAAKGAGYLTRPDNRHAKAGNINAAIARTTGAFFMVLDADFVPHRNFLYRAMGLFGDPGVGIVQIPHNFFNHDPMQTNLSVQRVLPDDQRLFFDAIMPGRDGWDCAFCCGSNSITRRAAIESVGGALPTGSITEDQLLTLALLRKGYKTRYLNERLAIGLAPESLSAFFVQRARWARGSIQMLFLRDGPLGPGLKLHQRLLFLPTPWLSQSLGQTAAMATPAILLWTGLMPLVNADGPSVLAYQVPAILGAIFTIRALAPGQYFPLAAVTHGVLQAFRLLPTVLATLVKPHGHAFKVTPKGAAAGGGAVVDGPTLWLTLGLMTMTALGLLLNASYSHQIVRGQALGPVVAFWAMLNMVVLTLVATIATSPPRLRSEERFPVSEPCRLLVPVAGAFRITPARLIDLSLSGAFVEPDHLLDIDASADGWVIVDVTGVGRIAAKVQRILSRPGGTGIGLQFDLPESPQRDALIVKLFAEGLDNTIRNPSNAAITWHLLGRIFRGDPAPAPLAAAGARAPSHIAAQCLPDAGNMLGGQRHGPGLPAVG